MGLGGKRFSIVDFVDNAFPSIAYRTGKAVWRRVWTGTGGNGLDGHQYVLASMNDVLYSFVMN
jgi:hypothetical protein